MFVCLFVGWFIYLFVCIPFCLFVCLFICLFLLKEKKIQYFFQEWKETSTVIFSIFVGPSRKWNLFQRFDDDEILFIDAPSSLSFKALNGCVSAGKPLAWGNGAKILFLSGTWYNTSLLNFATENKVK